MKKHLTTKITAFFAILALAFLAFALPQSSAPVVSPAGYTNNSPAIVAYFENARRAAQYLSLVDAWRAVAVPLANASVEPPPPPVPPFSVTGVTDASGNVSLRELNIPVYPKPEAIHAKAATLPGTCAIVDGVYQDPTGRIWVSSVKDKVSPGTVVEVSGVSGVKNGKYVKGDASSAYPGWSGPGFYDPAK